jgi:signal transduction histidine kinase/ActR/RegA family two-component response regulator
VRPSFRAKLVVMLSVLTLGFGVLIAVSSVVERQVERDLALIQERFIPLIALGPQLEQGFERMRRALQDAVAAQDSDALRDTEQTKSALLETVEASAPVVGREAARALATSVEDYYAVAFDVSRRLLAGETGAKLRASMVSLQTQHVATLAKVRQAGNFDHTALAHAFAEASAAQRTATRVRIAVTLVCLSVVLVLSLLIGARGRELETQHRVLELKNDELNEARRVLTQKAEELASVSSYKTQFLANMSHELRTPLNSMLVLSSLLSDNEAGNLTPRQVEFCQTIHGAGRDLLSLINQVLDLAKIESGKQEVQAGDLTLAELADHARRIFEPLARDKQLVFEIEVEPGLPERLHSDRRRIEQILNNLLGNAIKFTERGGVWLRFGRMPAAVSLSRPELTPAHTLAITIHDTGAGIAKQHQQRVFAPFEQVDGAVDRRYGGTGLGLSIARELTLLLGGELQLESELGQGSTFTCFLPFQAPAAARGKTQAPGPRVTALAPDAATATPAVIRLKDDASSSDSFTEACLAAEPADLFHGATLLVADDDMRTLYALSALLHAKGANVVTADSGKAALEALQSQPQLNAVLLDIMMPELDGLSTLRSIRAQPRFAQLPVVVLTAKALDPDRNQCLAAGASAHLTKPMDAEQLCRVLASLLGERASDIKLRSGLSQEETPWMP